MVPCPFQGGVCLVPCPFQGTGTPRPRSLLGKGIPGSMPEGYTERGVPEGVGWRYTRGGIPGVIVGEVGTPEGRGYTRKGVYTGMGIPEGILTPPPKVHLLLLISSGGHRSGRYTSSGMLSCGI